MIAYPCRSSPARASRMWNVAGGRGSNSSTESGSFRMPDYSHCGYIVNAYSGRRRDPGHIALCKRAIVERLNGRPWQPHEMRITPLLAHAMKRLGLSLLTLGLLFGILGVRGAQRASPLVVHEWGTITTRHAPNGRPYGRLNRISKSEVLPAFVHRYEPEST